MTLRLDIGDWKLEYIYACVMFQLPTSKTLSREGDLNPWPIAYEAIALPTELSRLLNT